MKAHRKIKPRPTSPVNGESSLRVVSQGAAHSYTRFDGKHVDVWRTRWSDGRVTYDHQYIDDRGYVVSEFVTGPTA